MDQQGDIAAGHGCDRVGLLALLAAAALFAAKVAYIGLVPMESLMETTWLIDDSFIFARVARNFALGSGYSFDGLRPTAGAPLAWTLISSLLHLRMDPIAAMKATMALSAACEAAAQVLVFGIARRLGTPATGFLAMGLLAFSAPCFLQSMNGMETSLFALCAVAAFRFRYPHWMFEKMGESANRFFWGAGLGLVLLVRADAVFLFFGCFAAEAASIVRRRGSAARLLPLAAGFAAGACAYAAAMFAATGMLFPTNQAGRRFLALDWYYQAAAPPSPLVYLDTVAGRIIEYLKLGSRFAGIPLAGGLVYFVLHRRRMLGAIDVALAFYACAFAAALVFYQGYYPDVHGLRYLHPGFALLCVAAARAVSCSVPPGKLRLAAAAAVLATAGFSSASYGRMTSALDWAAECAVLPPLTGTTPGTSLQATRQIGRMLPSGASVALKDHGKVAYFNDSLRIVDLTGILDDELVPAAKEGDLSGFLRRRGAQYVQMPRRGRLLVYRLIREEVKTEPVPGLPGYYRIIGYADTPRR